MISTQQRSHNFVDSVYQRYKLDTILNDGSWKFGFSTRPNNPFTQDFVDLIVEGFNDRGIVVLVVTNRKIKKYPSMSLTLELNKRAE